MSKKSIDLTEYLKSPDECPFCGTEDITAFQADFSYINAWREIKCNKCGEKWQEEFTITSVRVYGEDGFIIEE